MSGNDEVWFTSDQHFNHQKIIELAKRPFSSVEEMNEILVQNWNSLVKRGNRVYCLGDFGFGDVEEFAERLNGEIHFIMGNHDKLNIGRYKQMFRAVWDYKKLKYDGKRFILFHYPIREWDGYWKGYYHLYGHVHNNLIPRLGSCEVSVDCWNFCPVHYDDVIKYFNEQPDKYKDMLITKDKVDGEIL